MKKHCLTDTSYFPLPRGGGEGEGEGGGDYKNLGQSFTWGNKQECLFCVTNVLSSNLNALNFNFFATI